MFVTNISDAMNVLIFKFYEIIVIIMYIELVLRITVLHNGMILSILSIDP